MGGTITGKLRVKTDGGVFKEVKSIMTAPVKGPVNRAVCGIMIAPDKGAIDKVVL